MFQPVLPPWGQYRPPVGSPAWTAASLPAPRAHTVSCIWNSSRKDFGGWPGRITVIRYFLIPQIKKKKKRKRNARGWTCWRRRSRRWLNKSKALLQKELLWVQPQWVGVPRFQYPKRICFFVFFCFLFLVFFFFQSVSVTRCEQAQDMPTRTINAPAPGDVRSLRFLLCPPCGDRAGFSGSSSVFPKKVPGCLRGTSHARGFSPRARPRFHGDRGRRLLGSGVPERRPSPAVHMKPCFPVLWQEDRVGGEWKLLKAAFLFFFFFPVI